MGQEVGRTHSSPVLPASLGRGTRACPHSPAVSEVSPRMWMSGTPPEAQWRGPPPAGTQVGPTAGAGTSEKGHLACAALCDPEAPAGLGQGRVSDNVCTSPPFHWASWSCAPATPRPMGPSPDLRTPPPALLPALTCPGGSRADGPQKSASRGLAMSPSWGLPCREAVPCALHGGHPGLSHRPRASLRAHTLGCSCALQASGPPSYCGYISKAIVVASVWERKPKTVYMSVGRGGW